MLPLPLRKRPGRGRLWRPARRPMSNRPRRSTPLSRRKRRHRPTSNPTRNRPTANRWHPPMSCRSLAMRPRQSPIARVRCRRSIRYPRLDSPDGTIHGDSFHGSSPMNIKQAVNAAGGGAGATNGMSANPSSGAGVDPAWKNIAAGPAHLAPISIDAGAASVATAGAARTSTRPLRPRKSIKTACRTTGRNCFASAVARPKRKPRCKKRSNGWRRPRAERPIRRRKIRCRPRNFRAGAESRRRRNSVGYRYYCLKLLAMLGSGNTHLHGQYARNVQHGLEWLLAMQGPDGNFGGQATTFSFMYCHGMATFAMSEDYAMTHDRRLEQPLRRAIAYTIAAQHPTTGGWRFGRTRWATPANSVGSLDGD